MIKIYNSLTRQKEEFVPINGNKVNMYACGITVSGNAHIGHLYQALIYDIIRKFIKKEGYDITYARNYTDIDDKIISASAKAGVDAHDYSESMIGKINQEMEYFQIDDPDVWMKATCNVENIIDFISQLIEKGYAYPTSKGDVYYSVEKFKGYGKLSNRNLEDAMNGFRKDNDEEKRYPLDFALWKSAKPGEPEWDSPWGKGRPGWHIECSAMNHAAFGDQIDIHGGGRDLLFPHHENEIAQSEALTGKQFVKYWTHNGLIKVNGQKMSKSLGNSITLEDLRKNYHPEVVKFALLQNSYHNDINIVDGLFQEAEKHIYDFYKTIKNVEEKFSAREVVNEQIEKDFNEAMRDDFNTAKAIANLFKIFKIINQKLANNDDSAVEELNGVKKAYSLLGLFINKADDVLAFIDNKNTHEIPDSVKDLAERRWKAKQSRDWDSADELRGKIAELGYVVKDTKEGYEIEKS